jgi:adenylate cyclase
MLAAGLGVLAASLLCLSGALERVERRTHDYRFHLRGPRRTRQRMVLAEIQESTLRAWSEPMYAWGSHYAAAIRWARKYGVRWIGLDLIPSISGGPKADQDLFRALSGGRVVLADARFSGPRPILPLRSFLYADPDQGENLGFIDAPPEPDEVMRRACVYLRDGPRLLPSFPAVLALRARGQSPVDPEALRAIPGVSVDANNLGTLWINYVGPPGSFPSLPVERLAGGNLTAAEQRALHGAILLIGPAYPGDNDLQRGPGLERHYPGLEIHAHALATMLDSRPLCRAPGFWEALITAGIGVLVALPAALVRFRWSLLWAVAVGGVWCGATQRAFAADQLWPVAGPLLAGGMAWVGQTSVRVVQEARRRRSVEAVFGQHVSRAVVERLLRDPEAAALGGERRLMTILFSDIRGFTSRSEEMSPEEVVAQLNEYLGAMAECVFQTGGTLDKYIGDGLMAFWNSPLDQPDHARRGVATAWQMLKALERLNERWAREGRAKLEIGIGLNTAEVLVGNLGSEKRLNYTVIGHGVNLASRIESANKELKTSILLGETTFEQVQAQVRVCPHTVEVKGVRALVRVYELLEWTGEAGSGENPPVPLPAGSCQDREPGGRL